MSNHDIAPSHSPWRDGQMPVLRRRFGPQTRPGPQMRRPAMWPAGWAMQRAPEPMQPPRASR
jgi:hypothetical protein